MKFLKSLNVKHTDKLFNGKYKYKIVLATSVSGWFRGGNLNHLLKCTVAQRDHAYARTITGPEVTFAKKMADLLTATEDWQVRVETPFLSIYVNSVSDFENIVTAGKKYVKYVSIPDPDAETKLVSGTVLVKNINFDFKVTLGMATQNYMSFVQWCENNPKIRLPKRAARDLSHNWSAGGGFFYVKDEKSLILVKMFLGRTITKVETVVRA